LDEDYLRLFEELTSKILSNPKALVNELMKYLVALYME